MFPATGPRPKDWKEIKEDLHIRYLAARDTLDLWEKARKDHSLIDKAVEAEEMAYQHWIGVKND